MAKIIMSPSKYIQGNGELKKLYAHTANLGTTFLVLATEGGMKRIKHIVEESFKDQSKKLVFEIFNKECSKEEINRLIEICKSNGCDAVIGIGGGKLLDTAKAVSYYEKMPVVIVPTIASTDAPCSALSVLYTPEGVFDQYLVLPKNPEMVLMDTDIIAKAPARLLVAGMGDALATYFEARACDISKATNMAGLLPAKSAYALAQLCYETLLEEGLKAKLALENKVVTPAVENIIEANTYLSGIGFESGGLAAAHAIHNGFTVLKECHHLYHGEKVAFGTLVQLVMENCSMEEIEEVIQFCKSIELPITLGQMGVKEVKPKEIMEVAKASCAEGETIYNMPFEVTAESVYAAILTADAIGKRYL
ncbi:glycerol dehydrogenase [Marinisporobacter balticus]|uniref:Glycerol dehydrogenase n=1 Tax=Marinisporobacter balticus TaxID=2018667 RepID=A0A4R2L248_9FIRM|nr:glycerol dehydrogenase [Marinisporobacter balticus]TCO77949.1 glycerol 2-dehydrogenase (NAD+) [Marinisporobacter balticus]